MLLRAQYRGLVVAQLVAANTPAGTRVYESRALPTASAQLPAILVQTPSERKESVGRGPVKFTTLVTLVVVGRLEAPTYQAAEVAAETLCEQIELAILANTVTVNPIQQFRSVETHISIDDAGKKPLGEVGLVFEVELPQFYDPATPVVLTEIDVLQVLPDGTERDFVKVEIPTAPVQRRWRWPGR